MLLFRLVSLLHATVSLLEVSHVLGKCLFVCLLKSQPCQMCENTGTRSSVPFPRTSRRGRRRCSAGQA